MNVVLVVADDKTLCEPLRVALPDSDLVLFEPTIDDALRRLIALKADLVILDDTPNLGQKALARIRDGASGVPVLVLSSRGDPETIASFTIAGAYACLAKPFSCNELRETVEAAVQQAASAAPPLREMAPAPLQSTGALGQHQTALRWLSRISGHINDPVRISESLIDAVTDVYDAVRSAILLEDTDGVRITASHGLPQAVTSSARFAYDTGLMHWFELNACLIEREAPIPLDALKEMQIFGARIGAPLLTAGRVCGAILVGDKASGRDYSPEERQLLSMVARAASISVENARRYREIAEQQGRLDTVLSNISAGVVVVRPDRTIGMMNGSAEHILQMRAVDSVGRSVQRLGSGFADVALRTLDDGKPRMRHEVRDAAINATLGLSATPLGDGGVVVIFSRLPEEKASTEEIAYSPFWEYLASRVGQEIKNPLVAINTFTQLLPRKHESEEFRQAFGEVVQKEVNRINSVVDTLFEFARHPRLVMQRTNVNETVRDALRSFEEELEERTIRLETDLDPAQPDANLDPVYFSQAMHNVVQNSIDAMPSGGVLHVTTKRLENCCEIVISDTGPGVSEQDAPHIFMPFFSTREQGMGLGLTLANRIAKQHDGDLRLVPNEEGGVAFAFRLPPLPSDEPTSRKTDADRHSDRR